MMRVSRAQNSSLPIQLDAFSILAGENFQAVLAPQVAVALATDILAGREFIIVTLEISLLFDDPQDTRL